MISGNSSSGSNKNLIRTIRMDFTVKRGDTFSYVYDVSTIDANGVEAAANLTGYYAQMHLKKHRKDTHYFTAMATNIDSTAGTITFSKSAEDMRIDAGTYWYDLEIKDANSKNVTWIEGKFRIVQDITEWVDQIEKDIDIVIQSVIEFVKGFGRKYPVVFGYTQRLWTNYDHNQTVDYIQRLWKKFAIGFKLTLRLVTGTGYKFIVIFGLESSFAIVSRYMKMTTILFRQTLELFTNRVYYYKVSFTSSYDFEFTEVLQTVVEFYETYRFWTELSGYTEETES